jgi:hypothetical protein
MNINGNALMFQVYLPAHAKQPGILIDLLKDMR